MRTGKLDSKLSSKDERPIVLMYSSRESVNSIRYMLCPLKSAKEIYKYKQGM